MNVRAHRTESAILLMVWWRKGRAHLETMPFIFRNAKIDFVICVR